MPTKRATQRLLEVRNEGLNQTSGGRRGQDAPAGRRAELGNTALSKYRRAGDMVIDATLPQGDFDVHVLLAGPDTLYFSFDVSISDAMRARLEEEKQAAQVGASAGEVHCPQWLGARVLPTGARGGYGLLVETENFTVKLLGAGIPNRPGIYLELRSYFLHVHPRGPGGACEEAIAWVREHLLADQDSVMMAQVVSFKTAKLSRADLHIDWQGGYAPSLASVADELHRFIRPGKTKWAFYGAGLSPTGYTFGKGNVQARLYNKSREATEKANDAYFALLVARNGEAWDPSLDVWRLEFELKREGAKGFKLYAPPEVDDDEAVVDAELSAEELEHIGTLPRFFARMHELFAHLTQYWLRLVVDNGSANRSRWPLDPTWHALRAAFAERVRDQYVPLDEDGRTLVRGSRYSGRQRVLLRLTLGIVKSLEVEDAAPVSASLAALERYSARLLERETVRAASRRQHYLATQGQVPRWVERGMGARLDRAQQVRHRVQMLLGAASAHAVLPLEFKPAHTIGDLLTQHLDALEQEAEDKGGLGALLANHFARVYRVTPTALAA
jgi:hypothetical protein